MKRRDPALGNVLSMVLYSSQPLRLLLTKGHGRSKSTILTLHLVSTRRRKVRGTSGTVGKLQARLQKGNWWDHVPASVHLVVETFGYILLGETRCLPQGTLYLGIMVSLEKSVFVHGQVHESHMKS